MLKKRKLYKIVKKLMQENERTIPPIKECAYETERRKIERLKFYDQGKHETYFATAYTNILSGDITLYLGEELDGNLVCDTQYYGVQEDGTYRYCANDREYDEEYDSEYY